MYNPANQLQHMSIYQLRTPVVLLIFNRPDTTARVFAEIAKVRPPRLLVVADGPRLDRPGEDTRCAQARAIIERVDWDCDVVTNYSVGNLGCKRRVSSGLDWAFSLTEYAVILEDDCVPHPTFFRFCDELLEKYDDDERVMMISGDNLRGRNQRTNYSYYFSRYCHVWGWASWRRAWQHYDVEMKMWPLIKDGHWINDILGDKRATTHWTESFQTMHQGGVDTWDTQWIFTCWVQGGLSIIPKVNLVSNIGFHAEATHTKNPTSSLANMPAGDMEFPLQHPPFIIRDARADNQVERTIFHPDATGLMRRALARAMRQARLRH
jgi:hypothetical protein